MAYRFPGMDPYLEDPAIWRGFHHALAEEIRGRLNSSMDAKYYADVEVYTTFEEIQIGKLRPIIPDVAVLTAMPRDPASPALTADVPVITAPVRRAAAMIPTKLRSVRVYVTATNELITSIEILSPYNKRGEGLAEYRRKRSTLLASNIHLVEIDLLRGGERAGSEVQGPPLDDADYILLVNRGTEINPGVWSDIWPVTLDKPLPFLPIPLDPPDADVLLDMNAALRTVYERAAYARRIDYRQPVPPPALRPAIAKWMKAHLAAEKADAG